MNSFTFQAAILFSLCLIPGILRAADIIKVGETTLEAGHPSLQQWLLPELTHPASNKPTQRGVALGEKLFFDPRLSNKGDMSCATCHAPALGWSDGLKTATGANGKKLRRNTPTIINSAYGSLTMWDGRFENLEAQVLSPLTNPDEMNMTLDRVLSILENDSEYSQAFAHAYPSRGLSVETLSMAIASFERTVISKNSNFDRWVRGDSSALSASQIKGFEVFLNPKKGNCEVCHNSPNFSDDGYHNIGLAVDPENPDNGRFEIVPIGILKGAFKTPTLRDIESTKPYFHNGSAETLTEVLNHYALVDNSEGNLSPTLKRAQMAESEQKYLLDFLGSLTGTLQFDSTNSASPVTTHSALNHDD